MLYEVGRFRNEAHACAMTPISNTTHSARITEIHMYSATGRLGPFLFRVSLASVSVVSGSNVVNIIVKFPVFAVNVLLLSVIVAFVTLLSSKPSVTISVYSDVNVTVTYSDVVIEPVGDVSVALESLDDAAFPISDGDVEFPMLDGDVIFPMSGVDVVFPMSEDDVTFSVTGFDVTFTVSGHKVEFPMSGVEVIFPMSNVDVVFPMSGVDVIFPIVDDDNVMVTLSPLMLGVVCG